jgi:hypothetical protein
VFHRNQFSNVGLLVFCASLLLGIFGCRFTNSTGPIIAGALVGAYFLFAIKIVDQWEKVAVLRLGRYRGLRGPGLVLIIPILEKLSRFVDQRVSVSTVSAESTLTRDTVSGARWFRSLRVIPTVWINWERSFAHDVTIQSTF